MPSFKGYSADQINNPDNDKPIVLRNPRAPIRSAGPQGPPQAAPAVPARPGNKKMTVEREHLAKVDRQAEEGHYAPAKVSHGFRLQMQRARQSKGLTQKELAQKIQVPVDTIQKYESGKAIPSGPVTSKIKRILQFK